MENQALATIGSGSVEAWESPKKLLERVAHMQSIMKTVMVPDVHFGVIPGCKVPSLYQPGSQMLSVAFQIGHEPQSPEDIGVPGEIRYRVTDRVFDQRTGSTIAYGIGECSSSEEKYAWRKSVCDEEYEATDSDRRRIKFSKDKNEKVYQNKQVRTNPSDVANTVLKMAVKRANVAGTINALGAADLFTQDVEDMEGTMDIGDGRQQAPRPATMQPPTFTGGTQSEPGERAPSPTDEERDDWKGISRKQEGFFRGQCKQYGVSVDALENFLKVNHKNPNARIWHITWAGPKGKAEKDKILETIQKQPEFFKKYEPVQTAAPTAQEQPEDNAPHPSELPIEPNNGFMDALNVLLDELTGKDHKKRSEILNTVVSPFNTSIDDLDAKQQGSVIAKLSQMVAAKAKG
jgi:hypothetical protein